MRETIVVVGAGARDEALCYSFAKSSILGELHVIPGTVGAKRYATCHTGLDLNDIDAVCARIAAINPTLVVIGPEDLLVDGLATRLEQLGINCVGPSLEAAKLEGEKAYAKALMERAGVPTAKWRECTTTGEAFAAVSEFGGKVAVKANGLAAGCGAFVCQNEIEAKAAIEQLMVERAFGKSADTVIVEELLESLGEVSLFAVSDGTNIVTLPTARDYKRQFDGDTGPNTGGMGAYCPALQHSDTELKELSARFIKPIIDQMRAEGNPYRGVIYAGLMLTRAGYRVLEYNCRFGNPETQALVRVLGTNDLLTILSASARGEFGTDRVVNAHGFAAAVCMATSSYPEHQLECKPVKVEGVERARSAQGVEIFHGFSAPSTAKDSTSSTPSNEFLALGGRAVTVSAWGETLLQARERAYAAADVISFSGCQFRSDIALEEEACGNPAAGDHTAHAEVSLLPV